MDDAEAAQWQQLWGLPQATEWERLHQERTVALYVRSLVEADQRGAAVALRTLVRQLEDSLGISSAGMRSNRWTVGVPVGEAVDEAANEGRTGARERFRVVSGGG